MSVLIRGMEMPKCCTECSCCRHDNWNGETAHQCNVSLITFSAEDENWIYDQRPNWCPLIELPPHGRLGDLDELKTAFPICDNSMDIKIASVRATINHAPTVIEAEGETNGK